MISEITLTIDRPAFTCHALISWQGTATTAVTIALPRRGSGATPASPGTVALVRRLASQYDDTTIARILSRQHRRTATGLDLDPQAGQRPAPLLRHLAGPTRPQMSAAPGTMTSWPASPRQPSSSASTRPPSTGGCGTDSSPASSSPPAPPGGSASTRQLRDRIQPAVPDGWLPLDQAAKILGVSRQTVLHKVQTGQLTAVHVTRGRRKGLRIQVEHEQPGLFDTPHQKKGAVLTMTGRAR